MGRPSFTPAVTGMGVAKRALVVEDDPVLRMDAATMLEDAGLEVVQLETGDGASSDVLEQSAEVGAVVSDVQMPGDTDGRDLAHDLAVDWPAITIVMTSGHIRPTRNLPGDVRFVSKPRKSAEILAALTGPV